MHEMSLAESVRGLIEEAQAREGFSHVSRVRVEIGQLSGVEREAFAFCFDVVMKNGIADGARLEIVATEGRGRCTQCGQDTPLANVYDPCAHCGGFPVQVTGGDALRVIDLEVE